MIKKIENDIKIIVMQDKVGVGLQPGSFCCLNFDFFKDSYFSLNSFSFIFYFILFI